MRRTLPAIAVLAALLPAAPAAADGVPLRARMVSCTVGQEAADRSVTFAASVPRRRGAARLQMRFSLLQRLGPDAEFRRVRGVPGWDRWETSEPRRSGLVLTRRVQDLAAPASYRATVRFRWLRADGSVLRAASRRTRVCVQPDPRPDLRLGALTAVREADGGARYRFVVRNYGLAEAAPSGAVLVVNGALQPAVPVRALPSGAEQLLEVSAPACAPGSRVEVLLDHRGTVYEAHEDDNAAVRPCPLDAAGASAPPYTQR